MKTCLLLLLGILCLRYPLCGQNNSNLLKRNADLLTEIREAHEQKNWLRITKLAKKIQPEHLPDSAQHYFYGRVFRLKVCMKLSEPVLRKHLQGYLRLLQKDELTDSLTLLQLYSTYQYYHYQNGNQDSVYHYLTKQSAYLGPGTPAHYYRNHYNLLGIIFFKKREYELAYKMGRLAYQYALQTNTTLSGLGRMQLNLVSYALEMNKPEEARGILNQLLRENPSMPDFQLNSVSRYYVYREFSKLYTKTKQYDSALHFASLMAKVYEKSGGTTHQSLWYNNIMQKGRIFQAMDKCPEAEECFRQVYQSAGNSQFSKARRVEAIIELAHLAIHRKSIEEANRFLKEAFSQDRKSVV